MELSVVVPVHNEEENLRGLIEEVVQALDGRGAYEIVYVDDASTDGTLAKLRKLAGEFPQLRILRHGERCGQSTAILTGVGAAQAEWVATLDGDGQNDPKDILKLLAERDRLDDPELAMLAGWRQKRQDTWMRRMSSRVANAVRARMLKDATPDTGCGLKLFRRSAFLRLPYFDHMHRFLPALMRRAGGKVVCVPVAHRARCAGRSKYGINNRLWVGIVDLIGVSWLQRRAKIPHITEVR